MQRCPHHQKYNNACIKARCQTSLWFPKRYLFLNLHQTTNHITAPKPLTRVNIRLHSRYQLVPALPDVLWFNCQQLSAGVKHCAEFHLQIFFLSDIIILFYLPSLRHTTTDLPEYISLYTYKVVRSTCLSFLVNEQDLILSQLSPCYTVAISGVESK